MDSGRNPEPVVRDIRGKPEENISQQPSPMSAQKNTFPA